MTLPPYPQFPHLLSEEITLRQILVADIPAITGISYYDGKLAATVEQAQQMQDKINQDYLNGNSIHWGITDKTTNNIVGTCGYYRGFDTGAGEIGCVLLPQFRGKGFMTKAIKLTIDYGKNTMHLKRVFAITTPQNMKAIQLLSRLGFVKVANPNQGQIQFNLSF